jgi:segregation and condensation protein A
MLYRQADQTPYTIRLPLFEGPLDLLLHLIHESKIDIFDIPIVSICEQYLQYIEMMEALDLDVAGEWLVMAATLVEIKSRMLLPKPPVEEGEEEDPRLDLARRLIEYEKVKSAAALFRHREESQSALFVRGGLAEHELRPRFDLEDVTLSDLLSIVQKALADTAPEDVTTVRRRSISVRMRMVEVLRRVHGSQRPLRFEELFDGDFGVRQIVLTFVAVLELLKIGRLKARQARPLGLIEVFCVDPDLGFEGFPASAEEAEDSLLEPVTWI